MIKQVDKNTLGKMLGVGPDCIQKWLRAGIPRTKKGKKLIFTLAAVAEWMGKQSIAMHKYIPVLTGDLTSSQQDHPTVQIPTPGDSSTLKDALARARWMEEETFRMAQNCKDAMKLNLQKHYGEALDNRRKLEKEWSEIQLRLGSVLPSERVHADLAKILETTKDSLLSLPSSYAPRLADSSVEVVAEVLTQAIKETLRSLAVALRERGLLK